MTHRALAGILAFVLVSAPIRADEALSKQQAQAALRKAVAFFRQDVSGHGGYVWRYSADLARREGEGKATPAMAWVQPPGTPTVGSAYLAAYELTGDDFYLDAARETAHALVKGQLQSGGWDYRIYFDPESRRDCAYRVEPHADGSGRNMSTLDDDNTQSALRFLMRADQALGFKDEAVHEAALYGLNSLLNAQYPNGAWPQRYTKPPDPARFPVKKASYPDTWSRKYEGKLYTGYYTFNDNTILDAIRTLSDAAAIYGEARFSAAAEKAGDFILLAQMPDPQPAWAQQYDPDMHPAWARKFEPPSITGGESQGVLRTLIYLYGKTGEEKYLEPIPRAVAYFRSSLLPDGQLARFYELETNTPLYFTKDYKLSYSDDDMPTHYGFKSGSQLDAIEAAYQRAKATPIEKPGDAEKAQAPRMTPTLAKQAGAAAHALDERGAWVQQDRLRYHGADDPATHIIDTSTFVKNVRVLSEFIAAGE